MEPASDLRVGLSAVSDRRHLGLDGLRGLAVVWVVAFHLWPDVVPGGWLGVGLFFTLSGYLVVGLIDAEVTATGRLRLGRFMARRVRRLLPAALVTIASVLVLTAAVDDQPLREVGFDALTAVLNVFNWRTALDTAGYAAIFEARPEPLAHFWSLAIEEQFYLIVPAAAALTRRTGLIVCAMVIAGLAGVVLWWGSPDAYVATPVRALEIAAGAGLAVAAARFAVIKRLMNPDPGRVSRRWTATAGAAVFAVTVGLTVVALVRLGPTDSLVFRSGPQLMALCWVVWVIAAVRDGLPARIMSTRVLCWLGTRSYAIYLFHWPLVELTDWNSAGVIAVTLVAAEVSYRLVEMPVRQGTGQRALPLLAAAALTMALIAATTAALSTPARAIGERASGVDELPAWALTTADDSDSEPVAVAEPSTTIRGQEQTSSPEEPDTQTSPPTSPTTEDSSTSSSPAVVDPSTPTQSNPDDSPTTTTPQSAVVPSVPIVTVLGDSTALHIADGLRRWADANRTMAVVDRTRIGCYPLVEDKPGSVWRIVQDRDNVFGWEPGGESCRNDRIEPGSDLVLVVHHGSAQFDRQRADGSWASILDEDFALGVDDYYRRLVKRVQSLDAQLIFTTAPRLLPYFGVGPEPDPERAEVYNSLLRALVAEFESTTGRADVGLIDIATELEASGHDGRYSRSDGFHLDFDRSEAFAAEVLGPALLELLAPG